MSSKDDLTSFANLIGFPKKKLTNQLITSILNCPIQSEFLSWLIKNIDHENILNEDDYNIYQTLQSDEQVDDNSIHILLNNENDDLDVLKKDIEDHQQYLNYLEQLEHEYSEELQKQKINKITKNCNRKNLLRIKDKCMNSIKLLNDDLISLEESLGDLRQRIMLQDDSIFFTNSSIFQKASEDLNKLSQDLIDYSEKNLICKDVINENFHFENLKKQKISTFFQMKNYQEQIWDIEAELNSLFQIENTLKNIKDISEMDLDECKLPSQDEEIQDLKNEYFQSLFLNLLLFFNEKEFEMSQIEKQHYHAILPIQKSIISFGRLLLFLIDYYQNYHITGLKQILLNEFHFSIDLKNNLPLSNDTYEYQTNENIEENKLMPLSIMNFIIPEPTDYLLRARSLLLNISYFYSGPTKKMTPLQCKKLIDSLKNKEESQKIKNQLSLLIDSSQSLRKDTLIWSYFIANPRKFLKTFNLLKNKHNLSTSSRMHMSFRNLY